MYQELQIFEDFFDDFSPVWSTEGNDLPLPAFAVGDVFDPFGLPNVRWLKPPEPRQNFKVIAVRHAFKETGQGPEADYVLQVAVALDGLGYEQRLEHDLKQQERRANLYETLLIEWAKKLASGIQNQVVATVVSSMKTSSARGIGDDAESAWQEAASIAQADGHVMYEVMRNDIRSSIAEALDKLSADDQMALWLSAADLNEWFGDGWPENKYFQLPPRWRQATTELEVELAVWVIGLLHEQALGSE